MNLQEMEYKHFHKKKPLVNVLPPGKKHDYTKGIIHKNYQQLKADLTKEK